MEAFSAKNISTKFPFDILPARFVFKIILNFKIEALLQRIKVVQLSLLDFRNNWRGSILTLIWVAFLGVRFGVRVGRDKITPPPPPV